MRYKSQIKRIKIYVIFIFFITGCFHSNKKLEDQVQIESSYYSNGYKEFEAEYIDGKLNGLSKYWSLEGNLISEAQYINGRLHGYLRKYFPDQTLLAEINYSHGKKHGIEKWYYNNGQLKSEQTFIYGEGQKDIIRWHLDGSIIY